MHGNRGSRAVLAADSAAKFTTKLDLDEPGSWRPKPMAHSDSLRRLRASFRRNGSSRAAGDDLH